MPADIEILKTEVADLQDQIQILAYQTTLHIAAIQELLSITQHLNPEKSRQIQKMVSTPWSS